MYEMSVVVIRVRPDDLGAGTTAFCLVVGKQ